MRKSIRGFTIVELLIVVVVIGILAAIVTVAYTGITQRANDTKTIAAVNSWVKALRLYEIENGSLPHANSCFGTTTTYDGNGRCWTNSGWVVQSSFLTLLSPYLSSYPEPDTSPINHASYPDARGAFYYGTASSNIDYVYVMLTGTSSCPSIGSLTYNSTAAGTSGILCVYRFN